MIDDLKEVEQWLHSATSRTTGTRPYSELFIEQGEDSVGELSDADIAFLSHAHEDLSKALAIIAAIMKLTKPEGENVYCTCPECSYTGKIPWAFTQQSALCQSCKNTVILKVQPRSISSDILRAILLKH